MKNKREIHVHLIGDVYVKYTVSAQTLSEGECPTGILETLDLSTEELAKRYDAGDVIFVTKGSAIYSEDFHSSRSKPSSPVYNSDGTLTVYGVTKIVKGIASALGEVAGEVWEGIDPRCSAKIPSRLYRNVAYVCADALNRLGINASVSTMQLDPTLHNGLKNQYRVVVDTKVPKYPWERGRVPDTERPGKMRTVTLRQYERVNFDFDVTNQLRLQWVWPDSPHVCGEDARILRDGRPVRWVGFIAKATTDSVTKFSVMSKGDTPSQKSDVELLLEQSCFADVLLSNTDGTEEGNRRAVQEALGIVPIPETLRKLGLTAMNLG